MNDNGILIAMSAVGDGSMSKAVDDEQRRKNRRKFLASHDIMLEQSILVCLKYEGDNYKRYYEVGYEQRGDGMSFGSNIIADALFTRTPGTALFLPIADCVAVVLYDDEQRVFGLSHLGRHNLIQQGGTATVEFMVREFGTRPKALQAWLSPAAGRGNYPLYDFDNRSLHEVAVEQLLAAGVAIDSITIDTRDTTTDATLFSYSEHLKGNRTRGTQAVVAMMRP